MNWYYEQDGVSIGPVNEMELPTLVDDGKINSDSLVWNSGLDDWTTAILLMPALFASKAAVVAEPAREATSAPVGESAEEALEQEIKVKPVRGGAPSPSRLKRQAPSGDTPPPVPQKKTPAKAPPEKKPGLLKRLFGRE